MRSKRHPFPAGADGAATVNWPIDWITQQFAVVGESSAVLLHGMEAMRNIHVQAVQQAAQRRTACAGSLRDRPVPEVLTLQAILLRQDLESATQYWQQLASTAAETCAELWGSAMHLVNTEDALGVATRLFHA